MKNKVGMKVAQGLVVMMMSVPLFGCQNKEPVAATEVAITDGDINQVIATVGAVDYQPSDFVQADVDSDTIQWFCTSYAIFTQVNDKERAMVGGMLEDYGTFQEQIVEKMQEEVRVGWEIDDRETALEQIGWLTEAGHNEKYLEDAQELLDLEVADEEALSELFADQDELNRATTVWQTYQQFGEAGLRGWDLSRALQVIGDCYHARYLNLREALELSLPIAQQLQGTFGSWDELADSYLAGYQYWQKENPDDAASETSARRQIYEGLVAESDGPYGLAYDTQLVRTWNEAAVEKTRANEQRREQVEQDRNQIKEPEVDDEGYAKICGSDEDRAVTGTVKIPEGFVPGEIFRDTFLQLVDEERELELIYYIKCYEDIDAINSFFAYAAVDILEADAEDLERIAEELESDQDPMRFYLMASYQVAGEQKQGNVGYQFQETNDEGYQGIYVKLIGAGTANLSEAEAVALMFAGVELD